MSLVVDSSYNGRTIFFFTRVVLRLFLFRNDGAFGLNLIDVFLVTIVNVCCELYINVYFCPHMIPHICDAFG